MRFQRDGLRALRKHDPPHDPPNSVVVPGGWDHEHCEICFATISRHHQPVAMFSPPDQWVCNDCFQRFVQPRSLAFMERTTG